MMSNLHPYSMLSCGSFCGRNFVCSGRGSETVSAHTFLIIIHSGESYPVTSRLSVKGRLQSEGRHPTSISVYALQFTAIRQVSWNVKFIILGDFNARVGMLMGMISKHRIGKINSNERLMFSKYGEHGLVVFTNINFQ